MQHLSPRIWFPASRNSPASRLALFRRIRTLGPLPGLVDTDTLRPRRTSPDASPEPPDARQVQRHSERSSVPSERLPVRQDQTQAAGRSWQCPGVIRVDCQNAEFARPAARAAACWIGERVCPGIFAVRAIWRHSERSVRAAKYRYVVQNQISGHAFDCRRPQSHRRWPVRRLKLVGP